MSNHAVANRYAVALFELAQEKGLHESFVSELELIKAVFQDTPELMQFLTHPKTELTQKRELLEKTFKGKVNDTIFNTLVVLVERKRIDLIIPVVQKFKSLSYDAQKIAEAFVYSAKPLSEAEKDQLSVLFAKKVGKAKLLIENIVDPSVIGGLKIRIGDRIYDGSIKGQLDVLHRELVSGPRS